MLAWASDDVEHSFLACSLTPGHHRCWDCHCLMSDEEQHFAVCFTAVSTLHQMELNPKSHVNGSWCCVSAATLPAVVLCPRSFFPPLFLFLVFFLEAWQEHSGEVSQPCQLSGLVAVPSHRWLGMADQWIQPHSAFSLFIFPSLKWPNPSGGFSSCSHYKNSLSCISIPDTDFSITFPLQLLRSLYPETVHRGHNWSSEKWVLITYSMIKYHLALNIWGSFLSGQFIWFFDLQRFFIAIHGQMDVPCSWCKVYGFVLPFNNNHVRHSRGKCKGIFLAFRGENGRRNWMCWIELAAF